MYANENVGATGRVARYTRRTVNFPPLCINAGQTIRIGPGAFVCGSRLLDRMFIGPGDQTGRPYILIDWTELGIAKYPTF